MAQRSRPITCLLLGFLLLALLIEKTGGSSSPTAFASSPLLAQTKSAGSLLGDKLAKLCVLFNFPSGSASALSWTKELGDDVLLVNTETSTDLHDVSGFDVAVGYVKASDVLREDGEHAILSSLVALLEGLYSAQGRKVPNSMWSRKRLVFFVEGIDKSSENAKFVKITRRLQSLAEDASALVFPNLGKAELLVVASGEDASAAVAQAVASQSGTQIAEGISRAIEATSRSSKGAAAAAASGPLLEHKAATACMYLADDLVADVSSSLLALGRGSGSSSAATDEIASIVARAIEKLNNSEEADAILRAYGKTDALKMAIYRARTQLAHALQPSFRRLVGAVVETSLAQFEFASQSVPTDSQLKARLDEVARDAALDARQAASYLQTNFTEMVTSPSEGLFSVPTPSRRRLYTSEAFCFSAQMEAMQVELKQRSLDRFQFIYLSGVYNPFTREAPWPPTHININYFIDPRAVALGLEYDPLYDEHGDKVVNRADPLLFKGLAQVAFDANDLPVPEKNKPWWKILVDYYKD